jgi:hypothetical protein
LEYKYNAYASWGLENRTTQGSFEEFARDRFIIGDKESVKEEIARRRSPATAAARAPYRQPWTALNCGVSRKCQGAKVRLLPVPAKASKSLLTMQETSIWLRSMGSTAAADRFAQRDLLASRLSRDQMLGRRRKASRGHSVGCYLNNAKAERTGNDGAHAATLT